MGDLIPFPNRRPQSASARERHRPRRPRRVEWRAFNPHTGGYTQVSDEAQAIAMAAELNADAVEDGEPAVWRAERRTVGDWGQI